MLVFSGSVTSKPLPRSKAAHKLTSYLHLELEEVTLVPLKYSMLLGECHSREHSSSANYTQTMIENTFCHHLVVHRAGLLRPLHAYMPGNLPGMEDKRQPPLHCPISSSSLLQVVQLGGKWKGSRMSSCPPRQMQGEDHLKNNHSVHDSSLMAVPWKRSTY